MTDPRFRRFQYRHADRSFVSGGDSAEDVLAIRNQGTGAGQIGVSGANVTYAGTTIGTWAGGSGGSNLVVTLNANANTTNTAALIQNITYQNTDAVSPTVSTRTVRFVLTDGDGGTSANIDATVVLPQAVAKGLWISSVSGATTASGLTSTDSAIVQMADPNLAFEPGTTAGTFSTIGFDLDSFAADGSVNMNGFHYVSRSVTVGSANAVTLQAGDLLLSTATNETLGGVAVSQDDIILFRPTTAGNYSSGTFSILLQDPMAGTATRDFALVETATVVGGVTLNAGDFLLTAAGGTYDKDVTRYQVTDVGAGDDLRHALGADRRLERGDRFRPEDLRPRTRADQRDARRQGPHERPVADFAERRRHGRHEQPQRHRI